MHAKYEVYISYASKLWPRLKICLRRDAKYWTHSNSISEAYKESTTVSIHVPICQNRTRDQIVGMFDIWEIIWCNPKCWMQSFSKTNITVLNKISRQSLAIWGMDRQKDMVVTVFIYTLIRIAAFQGMHVSPTNIGMCDYQESVTTWQTHRHTDGRTVGHTGQSDPYVLLCFAGDTEIAMDDLLSQQPSIIGGYTCTLCIYFLDLLYMQISYFIYMYK